MPKRMLPSIVFALLLYPLLACAGTGAERRLPLDTIRLPEGFGIGLYAPGVPVGAPCNLCESDDPRYAAIHQMKPGGAE